MHFISLPALFWCLRVSCFGSGGYRGTVTKPAPPPLAILIVTMAAMMLSGVSGASLASRNALPKRVALKARAGQTVPMRPMGGSARAARLTVTAAAPTPGAAVSRYATFAMTTVW